MSKPTLIFASFLAPVLYKTWLYITEYVERYVGIPTFLLPGEHLEDFAAGYIDAGFISGLSYVHLSSQDPCPVELLATPVLHSTCDQQTLHAPAEIVVRADSALTSVEDLRECVWAWYEQGARAGSHFIDEILFEPASPAIPFKQSIATNSHAQSLRLVLDGKVDVAAIDTQILDIVLHNSPKMAAQLRIIGSLSPSMAPPVVVSTHMESSLRQSIQEALLVIHQDPFFAQRLQEGEIERFLPVADEQYQGIRERYRGGQTNLLPLEPGEDAHHIHP